MPWAVINREGAWAAGTEGLSGAVGLQEDVAGRRVNEATAQAQLKNRRSAHGGAATWCRAEPGVTCGVSKLQGGLSVPLS